jgi:hypothetical protein
VAITVAAFEADLLVLCGPYLTKVGLDGTTLDGTNDSLRIPIRRAVSRMGIEASDPFAVADPDLADVDVATYETLLDLAELKALEICWGNWPEVDEQAENNSQSLSQLADRLQKRIDTLREMLGTLAEDPSVTEAASTAAGAASAALLRTGLEYPPPNHVNPGSRRTFYHNGRYYS